MDLRIGIAPRLVVRNEHTIGTVLVVQVGTHDGVDNVVTLLHHRVKIGLLAFHQRADDRGVDVEVVLIVLLDVVLDGVAALQVVDVLVQVVVELRQAIDLVHHTVRGGNIGFACYIIVVIERVTREVVVLVVERHDGGGFQGSRDGVVVLRDMVLQELLQHGSTVAGQQALILSIAEGVVDGCPYGVETCTVECLGEVALFGKGCKLCQLLVFGDILPQRLVGAGNLRVRRHRVVVAIIGARCGSQQGGCQHHDSYIFIFLHNLLSIYNYQLPITIIN